MTRVFVSEENLIDTAEAIRQKGGTSSLLRPSQFADAIDALPDASELGTKSISANGTYAASSDDLDGYSSVTVSVPNTYTASDEGKVVSSGMLVSQSSITFTENGTYDTTDNNEVMVNVAGGGGGLPLLQAADWDALTTAQKQAYGLVAIQQASTGFNRGVLVNGADFVDWGYWLPNSNNLDIICIAHGDNYDETEASWGEGSAPITLSAANSAQNADGSVAIKTKTNGTLAYVDLGAASTPFTAYIVAKISSANSSYTRLLSAFNARQSSNGIMLYGSSAVQVSSWANDSAVSPTVNPNSYFVGVIQFGGSGSALGGATSSDMTPTFISKPPSAAGRYITIGRTDIDSSGTNAEPTDMDVLFLGVSSAVESAETITANMRNLAQLYL